MCYSLTSLPPHTHTPLRVTAAVWRIHRPAERESERMRGSETEENGVEMHERWKRERGKGWSSSGLWVQSYPCPQCSFYRHTQCTWLSSEAITLEESFALSCCKLGCALLHCLPPGVHYCCPQGATPPTLNHAHKTAQRVVEVSSDKRGKIYFVCPFNSAQHVKHTHTR